VDAETSGESNPVQDTEIEIMSEQEHMGNVEKV
jgi:hypothetical protein